MYIQHLKCFDFGKNNQFKPKNYNLPSCKTFAQVLLNKLAKNVRICVLKISVEPLMPKSFFFPE